MTEQRGARGQQVDDASDVIAHGFSALIDGLREDVRDLKEDLKEIRAELKSDLSSAMSKLESRMEAQRQDSVEYTIIHGKQHEEEALDRKTTHGEFRDFIRKFEIDEARKNGALGVFRYMIEIGSQHAPRIIAIIAAAAAAIGVINGSIQVSLGE